MKVKHIVQDVVFFAFLLALLAGAIYGAYTQKDLLKIDKLYESGISHVAPDNLLTVVRTNAEFYEKFKKSTVRILTESGSGSGFYVEGRYVVTNSHVVRGAKTIKLYNDRGYQGAIVIHDNPAHDLAVLYAGGLPQVPLQLGDSEKMRVGDEVRAIGSPLGLDSTYSIGMITGINRTIPLAPYHGLFQVDANIAPGSSGSALLNSKGEVIGLNFAAATGSASFGFSIPINSIKAEILQNIEIHKNPIKVSVLAALKCMFEDGPGCVDLP
jgi:S1-C subfamily serine protease